MRKLMLLCAAICATVLVLAAPAQATSLQTWVSASGADTGSCTQTAPCATFSYAMGQTSSGGAIGCLSSGSFGSIYITGSITIDCGTGQEGTITCSGCTAIQINTSSAATVTLRHLSIKGIITVGGYGIYATMAGGTLTVQDCTISGQNDVAIYFVPTSGRAQLIVSDTKINNNGDGIYINPNSGVIVSAMLDRVQITTIGDVGLWLNGSGTIAGSLRQSVIAGSAYYGIDATATGGVYFTVEESSVIDNVGVGIASFASGVNIGVGASTLGGNGIAVDASSGGLLVSFGNNQMSANGSNGTFTSTTLLQ
jgi:Right handed beta helix region